MELLLLVLVNLISDIVNDKNSATSSNSLVITEMYYLNIKKIIKIIVTIFHHDYFQYNQNIKHYIIRYIIYYIYNHGCNNVYNNNIVSIERISYHIMVMVQHQIVHQNK